MTSTSSSRFSWLTTERLALAGLLALALVVRGGVLFALREKLRDDPDAYREIAENLLTHGVFALGKQTPGAPRGENDVPQPTAYRPPLYPVILSNLAASDGGHVSLGKVSGLHLLLGIGTVWLTWLVARRLQIGNCELQIAKSGKEVGWAVPTSAEAEVVAKRWWAEPTLRAPLLAGAIVACDPILLNQSALVMTETLAAFLAVLSLWCVARFDAQRSWFNAGLAGGAIGLAVLCRPTFLPWLGLVAAGMLVVRGRIANCKLQNAKCKLRWADVGWRVVNCAALLVVAGAVVSPWVIRNQRVFGKPIATTTHGGYTLLLGNNDPFYEWLVNDRSGVPWNVDDRFRRFMEYVEQRGPAAEVVTDAWNYEDAFEFISANRQRFVMACGYRLGQLWSPLPNRLTAEESTGRRLLRYAVAAWYCGVYLLAAVGIWRLRWKLLTPPWVWGALLCLVFTGVHTFYWSNLRMRAPLMPFVALVAAAAVWPGKK